LSDAIIVHGDMAIRRTCILNLTLALGAAAVCAAAVWAAGVRGAGAADAVPRIISLSPHITELLFAAGAGDRIVGVDDASDYPAAVAGIARVGEPAALDVEALLKLKPTLIVLWDSGTPAGRKTQLERLNLRLYVTDQRRLDDIGAALIEFGRLAGTEAAAAAAERRYRSDLAQLRSRYAGRPRLKVFDQVWDRPLYTLSGAHVVTEVLSLCGGDNVFADLSTLAPAVDKEAVLARDPDVILIAATGAEGARQTLEWSQFSNLRAVRDHRVFTVDPSLTGRMAPRILQGVREVCDLLDSARGQPAVGDPRMGYRRAPPSPLKDSVR
jgi:iron complex transport system substrate-binding protein